MIALGDTIHFREKGSKLQKGEFHGQWYFCFTWNSLALHFEREGVRERKPARER